MGNIFFFNWEVQLIEFIQQSFPAWLIKFLEFMSEFGEVTIAVGTIGIVYWCLNPKIGRKAALASTLAMVSFPLLKNLFLRIRPYMAHESIECLKPVAEGDLDSIKIQGYSFPSGHSAISMSVFGSLIKAYKNRILTAVSVLIIFLVGFSRFTLGVHYPSDVLAGWALGFLSVLVMDFLDRHFKPKTYYPIIWLIACIGIFYCTTDDYFSAYGTLLGFTMGDLLNEKMGSFEKPKKFIWGICRILGGLVIYFITNILLKLPFSEEFLESGLLFANLYRTFRYLLSIFVCFGLYPQLFIRIEKKLSQ